MRPPGPPAALGSVEGDLAQETDGLEGLKELLSGSEARGLVLCNLTKLVTMLVNLVQDREKKIRQLAVTCLGLSLGLGQSFGAEHCIRCSAAYDAVLHTPQTKTLHAVQYFHSLKTKHCTSCKVFPESKERTSKCSGTIISHLREPVNSFARKLETEPNRG